MLLCETGEPYIVDKEFGETFDKVQWDGVFKDHSDLLLEYISFCPGSKQDFLLPKRTLIFPPESQDEFGKRFRNLRRGRIEDGETQPETRKRGREESKNPFKKARTS